jgi:hypothetical protein
VLLSSQLAKTHPSRRLVPPRCGSGDGGRWLGAAAALPIGLQLGCLRRMVRAPPACCSSSLFRVDISRLASLPASWIDSGRLLDLVVLQGAGAVLRRPGAAEERARGRLRRCRAAAAVRADGRNHGGMSFSLCLFIVPPPFLSSGVLQFLLPL